MPESPTLAAQGPIDVSVESDGKPIPESALISVSVTSAINRIPRARLVLKDGDISEHNFELSEGAMFEPGAKIAIKAGYDGDKELIYEGIVIGHRMKVTNEEGARLIIDCRDQSYAMTLDRKNENHVNKTDSDVIKSLVKAHSGLKANIDSTSIKYLEQVQYYCTDWDYLLSRADVNSLLVTVENGTITVGKPAVTGNPALTITYGQDIVNFDANIDGRCQSEAVDTFAWDIVGQKIETATAAPAKLNEQGDITSQDLAKSVGAKSYRMQSAAPIGKEALSAWASARQQKLGLARIRGTVSFAGSAKAKLGSLIELQGVSDRFNGNVYVSRVKHEIHEGDWLTHVDFGLSPEWFIQKNNVMAPPAAGWLPGVSGLHIGIVTKLDEDPDNQHRIQVSIPILGDEAESVWARLSSFYASKTFGAFFIPELKDEVILGFMNDDPSQPVILGSLYSSNRAPDEAYSLTAENNLKSLVTRSKLRLEFDDEKKIVKIVTPAGNTLILDDDAKSITLEDQNSNTIVMNSDGIKMDSPKDISIKASGNINLDAGGTIAASATQDVDVSGANISQTANMGFTAKGNASAELSAAGQTTVKGSMVMIN